MRVAIKFQQLVCKVSVFARKKCILYVLKQEEYADGVFAAAYSCCVAMLGSELLCQWNFFYPAFVAPTFKFR